MTFDLNLRKCKLLVELPSRGQALDSNGALHKCKAAMLNYLTHHDLVDL
jgi:hypothetical protein